MLHATCDKLHAICILLHTSVIFSLRSSPMRCRCRYSQETKTKTVGARCTCTWGGYPTSPMIMATIHHPSLPLSVPTRFQQQLSLFIFHDRKLKRILSQCNATKDKKQVSSGKQIRHQQKKKRLKKTRCVYF
jgi:hypothetical protein